MCREAKFAHDELVHYLPLKQAIKQNIFVTKMPIDNGFIADVESWLETNFANFGDNDSDDNVDDGVHSNDSISNVASILSGKVHAVVNTVTTVLNLQLYPASKQRQNKPHFLQELQL